MKRVLVIDDNPDILDALDLLLSLHDYDVKTAATVKDAVFAVSNLQINLIIQDMNFSEGTTSGAEGKSLFYRLKQIQPATPIIVITAWSQLETAIELVKAGAADYLPKPWDDAKLLDIITSHLDKSAISTTARAVDNLVYHSQEMSQLVAMAAKVAGSDISVLITGANGSGKEKLADYIHQQSPRAARPFIKVNMGAIPHELMEAELFGAEKGAYTGANSAREGRFEAANGGTLFLDEIGNLSLSGQMKLLRVLQTGEFERLGSAKTIKVDIRVISATNADLNSAIRLSQFREDLYYRLNVVELKLLPLTQRKGDILPLARHFIGHNYTLAKDAEQFLLSQPWPGNVRELENSCKRALVFTDERLIKAIDFKPLSDNGSGVINEQQLMQQVLDKHNWIIARASTELGLSRQALYRRIEKYQLTPSDK